MSHTHRYQIPKDRKESNREKKRYNRHDKQTQNLDVTYLKMRHV